MGVGVAVASYRTAMRYNPHGWLTAIDTATLKTGANATPAFSFLREVVGRALRLRLSRQSRRLSRSQSSGKQIQGFQGWLEMDRVSRTAFQLPRTRLPPSLSTFAKAAADAKLRRTSRRGRRSGERRGTGADEGRRRFSVNCKALTPQTIKQIERDEAGNMTAVVGYGPGFYLWLAPLLSDGLNQSTCNHDRSFPINSSVILA